MRKLIILGLFGLLMLFASSTKAQTVNHASFQGANPSGSVTWSNPQVTGDTLIVAVSPSGGTLSDSAGDTFVQDCIQGSIAIMRASGVLAATANKIPMSLRQVPRTRFSLRTN